MSKFGKLLPFEIVKIKNEYDNIQNDPMNMIYMIYNMTRKVTYRILVDQRFNCYIK